MFSAEKHGTAEPQMTKTKTKHGPQILCQKFTFDACRWFVQVVLQSNPEHTTPVRQIGLQKQSPACSREHISNNYKQSPSPVGTTVLLCEYRLQRMQKRMPEILSEGLHALALRSSNEWQHRGRGITVLWSRHRGQRTREHMQRRAVHCTKLNGDAHIPNWSLQPYQSLAWSVCMKTKLPWSGEHQAWTNIPWQPVLLDRQKMHCKQLSFYIFPFKTSAFHSTSHILVSQTSTSLDSLHAVQFSSLNWGAARSVCRARWAGMYQSWCSRKETFQRMCENDTTHKNKFGR